MIAAQGQRKIVVLICLGIAVATIVTGVVVWQLHDENAVIVALPVFPDPSTSILGNYTKAAVSCDAPLCAAIGKEVLLEGGNVVEAAIATLLCMGVMQSQSMGVGGGFLMVYYNATSQESIALTAREMAPIKATENMFEGNPEAASRGGLSIAVPGELKGYWEMYEEFGTNLPWARLVQPTIDLCRNGFPLPRASANALVGQRTRILNPANHMRQIFLNLTTQDVYKEGDIIRRPQLANTLELIANDVNGGNLLYVNSTLMREFVEDLQNDFNSILTQEDMLNYSVNWSEPLKANLSNGFSIFTTPPPGSGLLLQFMLRIMDGYNLNPDILEDFEDSALMYHRFLEAMKHAYAQRTKLGDPAVGEPEKIEEVIELIQNLTSATYIEGIRELISDEQTYNTYEYYGAEFYQPEDHGTSHLSIIGENGDAIAITSTINLHFGAVVRSRRTGIICNDEMDDFSAPNITNQFGVPPSPNNFIVPGKRPVSSMSPAIFVDPKGDVRLVVGGAGGTQITTSVAYTAMRNIWLGQNIKEAIDTPRLHHQLYGMTALHEDGFPGEYVETFRGKDHNTTSMSPGSSVVCGVARMANGTIQANSDHRKGGSIAGYDNLF